MLIWWFMQNHVARQIPNASLEDVYKENVVNENQMKNGSKSLQGGVINEQSNAQKLVFCEWNNCNSLTMLMITSTLAINNYDICN